MLLKADISIFEKAVTARQKKNGHRLLWLLRLLLPPALIAQEMFVANSISV